MASRVKTGGRKKGTPNKRTLAIEEKLAALNCDPIEGMAKIAMDTTADIKLRAQMFSELAQYVFPKRKSVEHSGEQTINYVARVPLSIPDIDEWKKQTTTLQ